MGIWLLSCVDSNLRIGHEVYSLLYSGWYGVLLELLDQLSEASSPSSLPGGGVSI